MTFVNVLCAQAWKIVNRTNFGVWGICRKFKTTIYRQTVTSNYLLRCPITGSTGICIYLLQQGIHEVTISTNIKKIFIQTTKIGIHKFKRLLITSDIKTTQRDDIDQIEGKNLCPHFGQAHRVERVKLVIFFLKKNASNMQYYGGSDF